MTLNVNEIKDKVLRIRILADQADDELERTFEEFLALDENPDSDMNEWRRAAECNDAAAARVHRFAILRDLADDAMEGLYMLLTALEDIEIESRGLGL